MIIAVTLPLWSYEIKQNKNTIYVVHLEKQQPRQLHINKCQTQIPLVKRSTVPQQKVCPRPPRSVYTARTNHWVRMPRKSTSRAGSRLERIVPALEMCRLLKREIAS